MKQKLAFALTVIFGSYALVFALSPFAKNLIADKIKSSMAAQEVNLAGFRFDPSGSALFSGLHVRTADHDIEIKKMVVRFSWIGLFKKEIRAISLEEAEAVVSLKSGELKKLTDASADQSAGKKWTLCILEISKLRLSVHSNTIDLNSDISFKLDIPNRELYFLDAKIHSLKSGDISVENLTAAIPRNASEGRLACANAAFNKVRFENTTAEILLKDKNIFLSPVVSSIFGGKISGHLQLAPDKKWAYNLELAFSDLDVPAAIKAFKLEDKATATGRLSGRVSVRGDASGLENLGGDLTVDEKGGDLVITDKAFLQRLADNTKQPLVIIEAGFKEYHYDTAAVKFSAENKSLGLKIAMSGEKGKRDLDITLHDIL